MSRCEKHGEVDCDYCSYPAINLATGTFYVGFMGSLAIAAAPVLWPVYATVGTGIAAVIGLAKLKEIGDSQPEPATYVPKKKKKKKSNAYAKRTAVELQESNEFFLKCLGWFGVAAAGIFAISMMVFAALKVTHTI